MPQLVDHRVLAEDPVLRSTRLLLDRSAEVVLQNGLTLLGVGAPAGMYRLRVVPRASSQADSRGAAAEMG